MLKKKESRQAQEIGRSTSCQPAEGYIAQYSGLHKARSRVPLEMTEELLKATRIQQAKNPYAHWHGYRVLMGEGT